jgi:hypothetical protein
VITPFQPILDHALARSGGAVADRYFAESGVDMFLHRIDSTGRIEVKISSS